MGQFLSIGIPVKNEEESIDQTIESLISSDAWRRAKSNRELIVCLNGSTDGTREVLEGLKARLPELRIIFSETGHGKTGAINEIAKRANPRTREIYFSDGDILVEKETISRTLEALKERGIEFAAPSIWPLRKEKKATLTEAMYEEAIAFAARERIQSLTGMGFAVRRNFLLKNPLPHGRRINDDRFINYAYSGKIRMVYGARVLFRAPTFADHYRARVRHRRQKRIMFREFPWLRESAIQLSKQRNPRVLSFFNSLSTKAKAGFVMNQVAELVASITARTRARDPWPKIQSTKIGAKRNFPK